MTPCKPNDVRATPWVLFKELEELYGRPFQIDVCALEHNAKCARFFTPEDDGLVQTWPADWFCNPPFSQFDKWIAKAWLSEQPGLMVVANNKTEQPWWHEYVEPYRDGRWSDSRVKTRLTTHNLPGRRRFWNENNEPVYRRDKDGVIITSSSGSPLVGSPGFGVTALIWR